MTEETDPGHAMANDTAMLAAAEAGSPGIRLYPWYASCVTLGRFQEPNDALVSQDKWPWAHRPTGGAAVLHGHDVTLTVTVPLSAIPRQNARPNVRAVYRALAQVAIEFLAKNGVSARLAEDAQSCGGRAERLLRKHLPK